MKSYEELNKEGIFVNNRKDTSYGIYVGRGSVLGNPFVIGKDGDRDEVIRKYRLWFWGKLREEEEVYREFLRICGIWEKQRSIALLCYCFPLACHAQVIGSALIWFRDIMEADKVPF